MDKQIRWYIKYHSLNIVLISTLFTVLLTPILRNNVYENFGNLRFSGTMAMLFGIGWLIGSCSLLYAVFWEKQQLIYPFAAVFCVDVVLVVVREIHMLVVHPYWDSWFIIWMFLFIFVVAYISSSLYALYRLFELYPAIPSRNDNFVRFDRNGTNGEGATEA